MTVFRNLKVIMERLVRLIVIRLLVLLGAGALLFMLAGGATGETAAGGTEETRNRTRHELAVRLFPAEQRLAGTDNIVFPVGTVAPVTLTLSPGARVKGVFAGGRRLPFAFRKGRLSIRKLPEGGLPVTVDYEGAFRDPVPENPVNDEDPGYGVSGSISPRGVFLSEESGWYPATPGPARFRVRVEAPEGMEAVTAGVRLAGGASGGRSFSEWEVDRPAEGIALSAGRYAIREGKSGDTPLYTYFLPEDDALAPKYLKASGDFLDLYRELFGPYPFGKFAVVENFFPTGYGFPSYTLLGSSVVRLPFIAETSLGHEIAHSWWGNGVLVDYSRGNWAEGLTTYVADHLYKERASREEGREYRLRVLRDFSVLVPPKEDFPLRKFTSRNSPASQAVGYGKAAMVFHMARVQAGDVPFRAALRRVVREKMFRKASWDDFREALAAESGQDFDLFFRQWVGREGAPVLALSEVRSERDGNGWKVAGKVVQREPHYSLQVPVRLVADGGETGTVVALSGKEASFELRTDAKPGRLLLDPDVTLFRRLDPAEIPPAVNAIRGSGKLAVVASADLSPGELEACKVLLEALGRKGARVLREEETPPSALAGRDVLLLGVPRGKGYLPPLPEGLSVARDRFAVQGSVYDRPADALFAVLGRPREEGRVTAIFLPLSPPAAAAAARKIPHYGKFGYLAFSDGVNRAKGSWPPGPSPSVVDLSP